MSELPVRKSIRLKNHDYSQTGHYFVTICTKDRREALGTVIVGRDVHIAPYVQLSEYGTITEKHINRINPLNKGIRVDMYVIMPNHVHLIIIVDHGVDGAMWTSRPTGAAIPSIVRSLKTMITKEIGFSLWQHSYHDHIIRNETDYIRICQYINDNPAKWHEDRYHTDKTQ